MLFIDAVNEVARERAVSFLKPEHQTRIKSAYAAFANEEGFAKVASITDIAEQGWSLSIPLYVKRVVTAEGQMQTQTLGTTWAAWEVSGRTFWTEMNAVVDMLDDLVGEDVEEVANG